MLITHSAYDLGIQVAARIQIKIADKHMQDIGSVGQRFEPIQLRCWFAPRIGRQQMLCFIDSANIEILISMVGMSLQKRQSPSIWRRSSKP